MSGQGQTLVLVVSQRDAQCLYDHIGTMPWAEGSWSNNLRSALSEALHAAPRLAAPRLLIAPTGRAHYCRDTTLHHPGLSGVPWVTALCGKGFSPGDVRILLGKNQEFAICRTCAKAKAAL